ncbi:flagellar biosynthesis protein FlhF [Paenibacillus aquistagni]|uniref:flagellar biosynthesis protein FlhF n=1 Tax=Paenibacillus aquistagni TaxID=1852522 RepID=UPI00145BD793|nr:flagellar biosynthesis protein FlhF [Paenibacillus aquistagni]NMM51227.1 flagellar biosynthesis protein FlhF [Paenibacillus aquistagni]
MRVKKYVVATMPEAMSQIRQELGKDAVIISTKEIKAGGFLGMFNKKMIEVTAAVDDAPVQAAPAPAASVQAAGASSARQQPPVVPVSHARSAYAGRTEAATAVKSPASPTEQGSAAIPDRLVRESQPSRPAFENKEDFLIAPTSRKAAVEEDAAAASSVRHTGDEDWKVELKEVKAMVKSMMMLNEQDAWPASAKTLAQRLKDQGVRSDLVYQLMTPVLELFRKEGNDTPTIQQLKPPLAEQMRKRLQQHRKLGLTIETKIVYFAGPTGVGKTTTIAKLAADQMFHHQRNVGFITSDTYRIAAVEQLRTYASILNAPLEVVTSPNDLQRAVSALQTHDLILMDTAGRNYRNPLHVNELSSLLKPLPGSEMFLVLSLTSKTEDMASIIKQFPEGSIDRIVFTKLDETDSFGSILNLTEITDIPFSYVTCGQNVPDDIQGFDPSEMVKQLLGDQAS